MADYKSPNGSPIVGTSDMVPATALINGINDDGTPDYAGSSLLDWDNQKTNRDSANDQILYIDDDGNEWTFNQLVKVEAEGEDDV